jgi:hypothetical protein
VARLHVKAVLHVRNQTSLINHKRIRHNLPVPKIKSGKQNTFRQKNWKKQFYLGLREQVALVFFITIKLFLFLYLLPHE